MKVIRSDNGYEFDMKDFYSDKGIVHQRTCVDTPPPPPSAERCSINKAPAHLKRS